MVRKIFIVLLCVMLVPIASSQALGASAWYVVKSTNTTVKYIQDTTTTEYDSGKWSSAAATTNDTVSLAAFFSLSTLQAGDVVYIKEGTITANATKITQDITVYGGFKDSDTTIDSRTGNTTIQQNTTKPSPVIRIGNSSTKSNVKLDGLTLTGGNSSNYGGGVFNYGTLEITNCTITGNKATSRGGGIYNYGGTLTVTNCTISANNSGLTGGGVYNLGGTLTMINCTISDNTAGSANETSNTTGGGIANYNNGTTSGTLTMINCTISNNNVMGTASTYGGGVRNSGSTLTMTNCTITNNTVTKTANGTGISNASTGTLTMTNTFLWGNTKLINGTITATYCAAPTQLTGTGNIAISSWNTQKSKEVEVNGVTHTVYRIEDNPELSDLEGAGTNTNDTPEKDQLGHTRYNPPCIGAVEIVHAPVMSKTLTIDAAEGKAITMVTAVQGLDIKWSTSGKLPDGLAASNTDKTFTISGTPAIGTASNSPYTYKVTAANSAGTTTSTVTINVGIAAPILSCDNVIILTEGETMTALTITALNGNNKMTWAGSGTLPNGLTASNKNNTFTISGTPSKGTASDSMYNYIVTAENTAGKTIEVITIVVLKSLPGVPERLSLSAPVLFETDIAHSLHEGSENLPIRVIAIAGTNITWSGSGTLPKGLEVSSRDNVFSITGTPAEGTNANSPYNYTVKASNTAGTAKANVVITVIAAGSSPVKPVLSDSEINNTYNEGSTIEDIIIKAVSGDNLTWSASGTLPDGLTVTESDDSKGFTISGKIAMNTAGSYYYTLTAKNSSGEAGCVVKITVEKFTLNPDTMPEPETNQTLSEYLSDTLNLSREQMTALTEIKIPSRVTTLDRIDELMPNLKVLDLTEADSLGENLDLSVLGDLELEELNLSGNSAIKTLKLSDCNIQIVNAESCRELVSINIAGNEFIEELYLDSTDISEINTRYCINLKTLHFANAKVSRLDFTGCNEMRELIFKNNRVRRFNQDHFGLSKLEIINAKNQNAIESSIKKRFDLMAFMLSSESDSDSDFDSDSDSESGEVNDDENITSGVLVINSAVSSGDKNLIDITGYDDSGNAIEYDASEYADTGEIKFKEAPAKIVYNYDTGLSKMDVTISGAPNDISDLGGSGGCDSGFTSGALLMLTGLAFIHRRKR
ncbi:MAG: hypothetical protein IJP48_05420 [Synergistaceae bacterium]|nr:hypothetical protein [Synergistaceae bacterium]